MNEHFAIIVLGVMVVTGGLVFAVIVASAMAAGRNNHKERDGQD